MKKIKNSIAINTCRLLNRKLYENGWESNRIKDIKITIFAAIKENVGQIKKALNLVKPSVFAAGSDEMSNQLFKDLIAFSSLAEQIYISQIDYIRLIVNTLLTKFFL